MVSVLAFSDLHTDLRATSAILDGANIADILIGAGDYAVRGAGLNQVISMLAKCSRPIVLAPGNHESAASLQRECAGKSHIHVLHGASMKIEGLTLVGLGYEIPSRNSADWNQTLQEDEAETEFARYSHADIIVTHTPAFGHCDLQKDGTNEGSVAVLNAVQRMKPRLHLCGHIHNAWGAQSMIGSTKTINLGPTLNWFKLV